MTPQLKMFGLVILLSVIGVAIIATVYIANGSEKEDAWLYIFSVWLIIFSAFMAYSDIKKKNKVK